MCLDGGGAGAESALLGEVIGTGDTAGVQNFTVSVIALQGEGGVDMRTNPLDNLPDPFGGTLDSGSLVEGLQPDDFNTQLSVVRFRGKINMRERITANTQAGNEDTNTNGG